MLSNEELERMDEDWLEQVYEDDPAMYATDPWGDVVEIDWPSAADLAELDEVA